MGGTIYLLNETYHIGSAQMPAPQATLIAMVAKGVIHGDLPYVLFFIGVVLGVVLEILRLPVLPFALGVYLPLSLTTATMVGALVGGYVQSRSRSDEVKERGILLASGLVGGDACIGIVIAGLAVLGVLSTDAKPLLPSLVSLLAFALLAIWLGYATLRKQKTLN